MEPLNLFFKAPEGDRWFPLDRYPRWLVRRIVRGRFPRVGGYTRSFHYLRMGLDLIGVPYRVNPWWHIRRHPDEIACIYGHPFVLDLIEWKNPIVFGAGGYSHPVQDPNLTRRRPVRRIIVKGAWMERMCNQAGWDNLAVAWAAGIDTDEWQPSPFPDKSIDYLLYDKIRWERQRYEPELLQPVRDVFTNNGRSWVEFRYGKYREQDFKRALSACRAMIFLCEHETQGLAYQQALACGVPILAWDRGGFWRDPEFYPHRVRYQPVTSVPYWDERCGMKFADAADFKTKFVEFEAALAAGSFAPRDYVTKNLALDVCARAYLAIIQSVKSS